MSHCLTHLLLNQVRLRSKSSKKQAKPVIKHHKGILERLSHTTKIPKESFSKKQSGAQKEVSNKGGRSKKENQTFTEIRCFDVCYEDSIVTWKTGKISIVMMRTRDMVDEEKEFDEERLSTEDEVSTVKERGLREERNSKALVLKKGMGWKTQEDWEAEEEKKQARIEARKNSCLELQQLRARRSSQIEREKSKVLHDTLAIPPKKKRSSRNLKLKSRKEVKEEGGTQGKRSTVTKEKKDVEVKGKRRLQQDTSQDDPF
ncbi:hypothetical protein Tco_1525551 [Tanacetum coccineum]